MEMGSRKMGLEYKVMHYWDVTAAQANWPRGTSPDRRDREKCLRTIHHREMGRKFICYSLLSSFPLAEVYNSGESGPYPWTCLYLMPVSPLSRGMAKCHTSSSILISSALVVIKILVKFSQSQITCYLPCYQVKIINNFSLLFWRTYHHTSFIHRP